MIEIEKRFILRESDLGNITKDADFLGQETFTDTYYDTKDYSLTKRDMWLRARDNQFELKIRINGKVGAVNKSVDQHKELNTEKEIRDLLHLPKNRSLEEDLRSNGYKPFTTIVTSRKKYKREIFTLAVDIMDFGYNVAEIELIVEKTSEIAKAEQNILQFARDMGLGMTPVKGKVIEYLARTDPNHYRILKEVGVV